MNIPLSLLLILCLITLPRMAYSQGDISPNIREISAEKMQELLDCESLRTQAISLDNVDNHDSNAARKTRIHTYNRSSFWDLNLSSWGSHNGEDALILFAVIGVIVVIAVIPYALKYIYDLVQGENTCYFHQFGLQFISTSSNSDRVHENNRLFSFMYSGHVDHFKSVNIGFVAEIGVQQLKISQEGSYLDHIDRNFEEIGLYSMVGPKLYFARYLPNPSHGYLQILGGASFNSDLGTIAKAEIGYNWFFDRKLGIGFSLGSLYYKVNPKDGFLKNSGNYGLYFSFSGLFSMN